MDDPRAYTVTLDRDLSLTTDPEMRPGLHAYVSTKRGWRRAPKLDRFLIYDARGNVTLGGASVPIRARGGRIGFKAAP